MLRNVAAVLILLVHAAAYAYERADCEQENLASLSLRACTQLLEAPGLKDEDVVRIRMRRGFAWLTEEEPAEAVTDFTHVLQIDPANVRALQGRARANTALGKHKLAAEDWATIIDKGLDSANTEANILARAASFVAAGDTTAALADYAKILELNSRSIKAHIGRANVFASANDKEKALAAFDLAQKIDPSDTETYIARGQAAERWGDKQMAIENYIFVVKNNTRSAGPWRQALKRLGVDTPP